MKYMTFNSSCSFAGVANMLLLLDVDVEDRQIALGMNLPYLFDLEDGVYSAGPMLQKAEWFNLYLNTLGYTMVEIAVNKKNVPRYLGQCRTAMIGLRVSPQEKHAVVFVKANEGKFQFINNKWKSSDAPEMICIPEEELMERLDDTVMVATIEKALVSIPNFSDRFRHSRQVLEQYKTDIQNFCGTLKTQEELMKAMNTLFRATLLDGVTMLELIGQEELAERLRRIRKSFLSVLREGKPVVLSEALDLKAWLVAIDQYITLIK